MPDDEHYTTDDNYSEEEKSEPAASVIFMEMMRRAAAQSSPPVEMPPYSTAQSSYVQTEETAFAEEGTANQAPAELDPAMEEQRIRRVKRRKARRRSRTVGMVGGFLRTTLVVLISAAIMATIFSFWTDPRYFSYEVRSNLQVALATNQVTLQPTGLPTPNWLRRIGIVSGHRGPENDPGAVCPDGLQEREINFNIAQLVVRNLRGLGYSVDLLDEFDPRLNNYQAAALVSIHANTCQEWPGGEIVSGYLVAKAAARPEGGEDTQLAECVATHYAPASSLERRFNLTEDMTDYHSFREIHPLTPAAIIELGFMLADRAVLTEQPDVLARGITDGILCLLEPGIATTTPVATP